MCCFCALRSHGHADLLYYRHSYVLLPCSVTPLWCEFCAISWTCFTPASWLAGISERRFPWRAVQRGNLLHPPWTCSRLSALMTVCAGCSPTLRMLPRRAVAIHLYSWCWQAVFGYLTWSPSTYPQHLYMQHFNAQYVLTPHLCTHTHTTFTHHTFTHTSFTNNAFTQTLSHTSLRRAFLAHTDPPPSLFSFPPFPSHCHLSLATYWKKLIFGVFWLQPSTNTKKW